MTEQEHTAGPVAPTAEAMKLVDMVQYAPGSVVSRTVIDNSAGTLTLFAFDAGQGLSEHSAPFDAVVQVLDGQVEMVIGGKKVTAEAGDMVIMPANVPHSLSGRVAFKMLLTMLRSQ